MISRDMQHSARVLARQESYMSLIVFFSLSFSLSLSLSRSLSLSFFLWSACPCLSPSILCSLSIPTSTSQSSATFLFEVPLPASTSCCKSSSTTVLCLCPHMNIFSSLAITGSFLFSQWCLIDQLQAPDVFLSRLTESSDTPYYHHKLSLLKELISESTWYQGWSRPSIRVCTGGM